MIKILVADLLDTLLPMQTDHLNLLYGTRENVNFQDRSDDVSKYWTSLSNKAMNAMIEELKIFLEQNNELVIVTSLSHFGSDVVVEEYIKKIYSALPQYFNQIKVVFQGQEYELENNHVILEDGMTYLEIQGFKIGFVYNKEDAFDFIDISGKQLYTIGNNCLEDSGMMLRCFNQSGSVSLINYYLNKPISTDEDTIRYYINYLVKTKRDLGLCEYATEFRKITASYREGNMSIQDIYKLLELYGIIEGYNIAQRGGNFDIRGAEITDSEYIERFVASSSIYPTFKDYNRRVLTKK